MERVINLVGALVAIGGAVISTARWVRQKERERISRPPPRHRRR